MSNTINGLIRGARVKKMKKKRSPLSGFPQMKGRCVKVMIRAPKKPNSAQRKVCEVTLSNKKTITAYIPGEKHNLIEHGNVLVTTRRRKDLPGIRLIVVRGVYDVGGVVGRCRSRSKYGTKKKKVVAAKITAKPTVKK